MRVFTPAFWQRFWQHTVEAAAGKGLVIIGVLIAYILARAAVYRIVDAAMARILAREDQAGAATDRTNRLRTLQTLVKSVAGYLLFFVLVIIVLDTAGANVAGLITTAGIGGIAIGFGAQRLVRDVISGFFIIMENQFAVGEYVTISGPAGTLSGTGAAGVVENLGMRVTRLRDDTGRLWVLANGDITAVVNHSRNPVQSFIEVGIGPSADPERARTVVDEAGQSLFVNNPGGLAEAPRMAGVAAYDGTRTTLRIAFVANPRTLAQEQLRVRGALRASLAAAEIPLA